MNIELPEIEKGLNDITVIYPGKWYYPQTSWTDINDTVDYCSLDYKWEVYNSNNAQWELSTIHPSPSGNYASNLSAVNIYSIDPSEVGKFVRIGLKASFQGMESDFVYSNAIYINKYFYTFADPTEIYDILEFWLDGSDATSLFVDLSGTIPVATTGDRISCWKDKSKYKRHVTQTTQSKKPFFVSSTNLKPNMVLNTNYKSNVELRTTDVLDSAKCKTIICGMEILSNNTFQGAGVTPLLFGSLTNAYGCRNSGCQSFGAPQDVFYNTSSHIWAFSTTQRLRYCEYLSYTIDQRDCYFLDKLYEQEITPSPYAQSLGGVPFVVAWSYNNFYGSTFTSSIRTDTFYDFNNSVINTNYKLSQTGYFRLFSGGTYVTNLQGIYQSSAGGSFVGAIKEVIVLNKSISPNDYSIIYNYLKNKWNVN